MSQASSNNNAPDSFHVMIDVYLVMPGGHFLSVALPSDLRETDSLRAIIRNVSVELRAKYPMVSRIIIQNIRLPDGGFSRLKDNLPSERAVQEVFGVPGSRREGSPRPEKRGRSGDEEPKTPKNLPPEPATPQKLRLNPGVMLTANRPVARRGNVIPAVEEIEEEIEGLAGGRYQPLPAAPAQAQSVLKRARTIRHCEGCAINAPSQRDHTCIMQASSSSSITPPLAGSPDI